MRRCLSAVLLATVALLGLTGCAAYVEPEPVVYRPYYYDPYCYHPAVVVVGGGYYGYHRWR
jgi:hypothetical protein